MLTSPSPFRRFEGWGLEMAKPEQPPSVDGNRLPIQAMRGATANKQLCLWRDSTPKTF